MYILGGLDDQINVLIWGSISNSPFIIDNVSLGSYEVYKSIFHPFLNPLLDYQPIAALFFSFFLSIFGSVFYNIFLFITLAANFFSSYILFKRFKFPLVYSLIYTFSSYMWIHIGVHPVLSQMWIFPLFLHLLLGYFEKGFLLKHSIKLGIFIAIATLISNYYGFFVLILYSCFMVVQFNTELLWKKAINTKLLKFFLFSLLTFVAISSIFLLPYIKSTYFSKENDTVLERNLRIHKPLEDFMYFSSRPWYFLIPPVRNPIYENFSKNILVRLENTNYFLADDYFANEHSGNFFGYVLLLATFATLFHTFLGKEEKVKKNIVVLFGVLLILFLLMMPPFFTISGFKFWTPGYLMYKFFPMFRVTERLSAVFLVVLLLVLGYGIDFVVVNINRLRLIKFFMFCLLVTTLAETFVPLRISKIDEAPAIYNYLNFNTEINAKFAVFPYESTTEAMYFLPIHKRLLMNPREHISDSFNSEKFTKSLISSEGLSSFKDLGGMYLLVDKSIDPEDLVFFVQNPKLTIEFEDSDYYLFKKTESL